MVAFRTIITSLLAPILLSGSVLGAGLFESSGSNHLLARQNVVDGNICAQIDLVLLGITFAQDVCICAEAGVITPASVLTLNQQITANAGVLAPVINLLGGTTQALTRLVADLTPVLLAQPTSCVYPANSTPNACGSCGYECQTDFVACGDQCIPVGDACVSGLPQKRGLGSRDSCPVGFEACRIPSSSGYECIKTSTDLESCGGCLSPLPGRPLGQDCSAIPNIGSAMCQAGRCVIETCTRGFASNGTACEPSGRKLAGYWAALHEASHVILQE